MKILKSCFMLIIIGVFSFLTGCNDVTVTNTSIEKNDWISYYAVSSNGIQKPIRTYDKNFYVYDHGKFEYAFLTDSGEKKDSIQMLGTPAIFESDNTYKVSGEYTPKKITLLDPYTGNPLIVFNNVYVIRFGSSSMYNKFIDCDSGKQIMTVNIPAKLEKKTTDEIKNLRDNLIIREKLQGRFNTSDSQNIPNNFETNELKRQEKKKNSDYSDEGSATQKSAPSAVINNITINNQNGQ